MAHGGKDRELFLFYFDRWMCEMVEMLAYSKGAVISVWLEARQSFILIGIQLSLILLTLVIFCFVKWIFK